MSNEFNIVLPSSSWTVYGILLRDSDGKAYNTSSLTFETLDTNARSQYAISYSGSGYEKLATMPSVAAASYVLASFKQQGGSPSTSDLPIGDSGRWYWSGTAFVDLTNSGGGGGGGDPWATDISNATTYPAGTTAGGDLRATYSRQLSPTVTGPYAFTRAHMVDYFNHLLTNANIPNIGDATGLRGSSVAGSLYISLHTADPGASGTQTTSESAYTGYARQAVVRSASGWTVTNANPCTAVNTNTITFPIATGGSETLTYIGVGTQSSGAGELLFRCQMSSTLAVLTGVTPSIQAGALILQGP